MGITESKSPLVPWDLDYQSTQCMQCQAPFTSFTRRHHCRACGQIVCTTCGQFYGYLWHLGLEDDVAYRICRQCAGKSLRVIGLERDAYAFTVSAAKLNDSEEDIKQLCDAADLLQRLKEVPEFNSHLLAYFRRCFQDAFNRVSGLFTMGESSRKLLHSAWKSSRELVEINDPFMSAENCCPTTILEKSLESNIHSALASSNRVRNTTRRVQFRFDESKSNGNDDAQQLI